MACARVGQGIRAMIGILVLLGAVTAARAQDSCKLLVFTPGQTDGEVADTAPAEGSVCYAVGAAPGQVVSVALTFGDNAQFSIAGLVQDRRSYEFTAERSLYEIRIHQPRGADDVEPFVLAVHAEPVPVPEPATQTPPPTPERAETTESPPAEAAPEESGTGAVASAVPADPPAAPPAARGTAAPPPGDPAEDAPTDAVPTDGRVYGPQWTVDDVGTTIAVRGRATDYVTEFEGRCGAGLTPGLHASLRSDALPTLPRADGAVAPVRLQVTGEDGTVSGFDATLAYSAADREWRTRQPLSRSLIDAFGDGVLMKIATEEGAPVATFILFGTAATAELMQARCPNGAGSAAIEAQPPVATDPDPDPDPDPEPEPTPPAAPVASAAPPADQGWSTVRQGRGVVTRGTAADGVTRFEGRCGVDLAPGFHVTLSGVPMGRLQRDGDANDPVRIEITAEEDVPPEIFSTVLRYRPAEQAWATQLPLPPAFVYAFGHGMVMALKTPDGRPVATFVLTGTGHARDTMRQACGF